MKPASPRDRAVVLLVVFVVLVITTFIAASIQSAVDASTATTMNCGKFVQSRAAAWSGVQVVMAALESQREGLLGGSTPKLESSLLAWSEGPNVITADLITFDDGLLAHSEAGKLNINTSSEVSLSTVGMPHAAKIVGRAHQHPFGSIDEALAMAGSDGDAAVQSAVIPSGKANNRVDAVDLHKLLTVYSFDPNMPVAGEDARINISGEWTSESKMAIAKVLNGDIAVAESIAKAAPQGVTRRSKFVRVLRTLNVPVEYWGRLLDTTAFHGDEFVTGLVDLSTADQAVLSCIPGIDGDCAAQIVRVRETLDLDARKFITWPLDHGILTQDRFELAVDALTTRGLQYRVVVAAGFVRSDQATKHSSNSDGKVAALKQRAEVFESGASALRQPVVLEAVLDVSAKRVRVAYLRDITHLAAGREVARYRSFSPSPNENLTKTPDFEDGLPRTGNNQPIRESEAVRPVQGVPSSSSAMSRDGRIGRWKNSKR